VGDSAHSLFVNLNTTDLATYLANRQGHGFNIIWVEALCSDYISNCRNDLSTYDGIKPFLTGTDETNYDIATPNPDYWSRVDTYVNTAAGQGITVLFDTWETGALMPLAEANGNTKMFNFGAFLGNRYKDVANIVWITGNDFQTWPDNTDNTLIKNLMAGLASVDTNHLQTTQLDYFASGSLDDSLLAPYTTLSGVYDYYCSYGVTSAQYSQSPHVPVFFEEGYYEFQNFVLGNTTTSFTLRKQAWWAVLSGATAGQIFGSEGIYPFSGAWQGFLDSVGVDEFGHMVSLLKSLKWYNLVPDQGHTIVTAGYGTADASPNQDCINSNDYVTTSYLADGTAALAYTPGSATLTVDMSRFSGPVTAVWYDPASGASSSVAGSPFTNSGSVDFATPGSNSAGDPDWVLLLTTN
jgi:Protein of unknown function (DUF4038)/Putative collagen-binding domain of a collagenase